MESKLRGPLVKFSYALSASTWCSKIPYVKFRPLAYICYENEPAKGKTVGRQSGISA